MFVHLTISSILLIVGFSSNPSDLLIWTVAAVLGLISVLLIVLGYRGKKVDGHPLCRTCRHDLHGSTNAVRNCPKCGRPLRYHKDVVVGNRRKQKGRIGKGVSGVFIAFVIAVFAAFPAARQLDWLPELPSLSMPRFTLSSKLQTAEDWQQVYQQLETTSISKSQANRIAEVALELQEDHSRDWIVDAGLFVEKVHEQGNLEDKIWMRYVNNVIDEQVAAIKVPVRSVIDHGTRPYFQIHNCPPVRSGELRLDFLGSDGKSRIQVNDDQFYSLHYPDDEDWSTLPTGQVKLRCMMVQRYCFNRQYDESTRRLISKTGEVFERNYELVKQITILPIGQSSVSPLDAPQLLEQVKAAINSQKMYYTPRTQRLDISMSIDRLPVSIAYAVKIRIAGKVYDLNNPLAYAKGRGQFSGGMNVGYIPIPKEDIANLKSADLILEPNEKAARRTLDITEYWNHSLTYESVPVTIQED